MANPEPGDLELVPKPVDDIGFDILDVDAYTTNVDFTISGPGSVDGLAGSTSAVSPDPNPIGGTFDNIDSLLSGSGSDTLVGVDAQAGWDIDGTNIYNHIPTPRVLNFSGVESLVGGNDVDVFTISGDQTHEIDAGSGDDSFVFEIGAQLTGAIVGGEGGIVEDKGHAGAPKVLNRRQRNRT